MIDERLSIAWAHFSTLALVMYQTCMPFPRNVQVFWTEKLRLEDKAQSDSIDKRISTVHAQ